MRFLANIALAVVWCALTGSVDEWNFLGGMFVGALVITAYNHATGARPYFRRGVGLLHFFVYFLVILVRSNLQIAWEVLTPSMHQSPRIIRYPVHGLTTGQLTALASAITLTPGTLAVDVSPDNEWLYIHCMYAKDRETAVAQLDELAKMMREKVFS